MTTKWQELVRDFQELSPEERLEEIVELAGRLPPVSKSRGTAPFSESCRVQECQTPVYLWVDVVDGKVRVEAEVSPKSPTVRGLVSLAVEIADGLPVAQAASLPTDWVGELGLTEALGMTRQQGFRGVILRIRAAALAATGGGHNSPGNGEK